MRWCCSLALPELLCDIEHQRDELVKFIEVLNLCSKPRFLELIHDFIVFDNGVKKSPRHN